MADDITTREPDPAAHAGSNLAGQAYTAVSDMIRHRRLRGGEAIVESRLAETLGVSRTPLREALQRLEGEGMVVKATGRSFVVRRVDLGEYLQSLKVREILEPEAAVLAIGRIPGRKFIDVRREIEDLLNATAHHTDAHWQSDDNLHNLFIDHCANEVMARILRQMRATTRLFEIDRLKDRLVPDSTEHLTIIRALESGDAKATRKATAAHIDSLIRFALAQVR